MKRVYVDQDDVLAEYTKERLRRLELNPEQKFPQAEWGFFLDLEEMPGAKEGLNLLSKSYDTWILTRPSAKNPLCYTEKRVWVERHLGMEWIERLIICPNKALMIGDYLIDDRPWPEFQGEQILFGQEPYSTWDDVLIKLGVK